MHKMYQKIKKIKINEIQILKDLEFYLSETKRAQLTKWFYFSNSFLTKGFSNGRIHLGAFIQIILNCFSSSFFMFLIYVKTVKSVNN